MSRVSALTGKSIAFITTVMFASPHLENEKRLHKRKIYLTFSFVDIQQSALYSVTHFNLSTAFITIPVKKATFPNILLFESLILLTSSFKFSSTAQDLSRNIFFQGSHCLKNTFPCSKLLFLVMCQIKSKFFWAFWQQNLISLNYFCRFWGLRGFDDSDTFNQTSSIQS